MVITYILQIAWLGMFCFLVVVTATYSVFWTMCTYIKAPYDFGNCIDFTQFRKFSIYQDGAEEVDGGICNWLDSLLQTFSSPPRCSKMT